MSTYLRNNKIDSTEQPLNIGGESWDLDVQLENLLNWLKTTNFDFTGGEWIVDIGYDPRENVTVAGYTIPVELMKLLVERNITLWLSDYLNVK